MSTTSSLVTFAQFEQLPEVPGKQELVDGEIIYLPPSVIRHAQLAKRFYKLLQGVLNFDQLWHESGYRIAGGWMQPDVSVSWPDQGLDSKYMLGGPMLAIEILSPSNTRKLIDRKLARYFAERTGEVWIVDDAAKALTVYLQEAHQLVRTVVHDVYASPLLNLTVDVSAMLAD